MRLLCVYPVPGRQPAENLATDVLAKKESVFASGNDILASVVCLCFSRKPASSHLISVRERSIQMRI